MILTTFLLIVAAIVTLAGLGLYFGQQLGLLFLLTSFTIMLVTGMYLIGGSSINIPTGDEHYAYNQTTGDYTVTTYTENNNWFDKIVGWTFTFGGLMLFIVSYLYERRKKSPFGTVFRY